MKRLILFFAIALIATNFSAQNKWSIYGGVNITEKSKDFFGSVKDNGSFVSYYNEKSWNPGGFVGIAYDIKFKHNLSLQPALEYNILNQTANYYEVHYDIQSSLPFPPT